jgi:hypothetical protein
MNIEYRVWVKVTVEKYDPEACHREEETLEYEDIHTSVFPITPSMAYEASAVETALNFEAQNAHDINDKLPLRMVTALVKGDETTAIKAAMSRGMSVLKAQLVPGMREGDEYTTLWLYTRDMHKAVLWSAETPPFEGNVPASYPAGACMMLRHDVPCAEVK